MSATSGEHARILSGLKERAARRCYGRLYPTLAWEDASDQGKVAAHSNMKAADVLAVVETDLVLAGALSGSELHDQGKRDADLIGNLRRALYEAACAADPAEGLMLDHEAAVAFLEGEHSGGSGT